MPELKVVKKDYSNTSPRGYLSWSQLNLWEKDPNLYYQVYVEGIDLYRSKFLELGKRLANVLETGIDEEHDPAMEYMGIFLPAYPKREYKLEVIFEGIPLLGKLDGFDEKRLIIGEYKTGKNWTQGAVDKCGQLTFYAFMVWLKYKKFPKEILLHWTKTKEDAEGNLSLTGDIKTFKTERTLKDFILFSKRIKNAWSGICELGKNSQPILRYGQKVNS